MVFFFFPPSGTLGMVGPLGSLLRPSFFCVLCFFFRGGVGGFSYVGDFWFLFVFSCVGSFVRFLFFLVWMENVPQFFHERFC